VTIAVRVATLADEVRCLALLEVLTGMRATPAWRTTYRRLLDGTRGVVWAAEESGTILGVATVSYNLAIRYAGEYAQLEELIVDPAVRGRNVGGLLMDAALAGARERGCAEMGLYLVERTEGNRAFYERFGFGVVGTEMRRSVLRSDISTDPE